MPKANHEEKNEVDQKKRQVVIVGAGPEDKTPQLRGGHPIESVRPIGKVRPVVENQLDDFPEAQRDDGDIVMSYPENRKAQEQSHDGSKDGGKRQGKEEGKLKKSPEDSIGVGADTEKGGMPEIQQAGKSDNDVKALGEDDIDQYIKSQVYIIFGGKPRENQRQDDDRQEPGIGSPNLILF
jgi:hypothetical protein